MRAGLHIIPPIFQYVCICHALKPRASRRTTLQAQVGGSIRPRFLAPLLILRPIPGPAFWPLSMQLCGWGLAVSTQVRGQRWLPAARGWDGVVGGGWLGERAARTSKAMDEPASGRRATQSRQHGCGRTLRDWSGGQVASAPATLPTFQGRPGGSSKGSWAVGAQHRSRLGASISNQGTVGPGVHVPHLMLGQIFTATECEHRGKTHFFPRLLPAARCGCATARAVQPSIVERRLFCPGLQPACNHAAVCRDGRNGGCRRGGSSLGCSLDAIPHAQTRLFDLISSKDHHALAKGLALWVTPRRMPGGAAGKATVPTSDTSRNSQAQGLQTVLCTHNCLLTAQGWG